MNSKPLLYLGSLIPFIFFGTTFLSGYIQGDYNHLTRMVSELGTIGTRSQYVFMAGLLSCSVFSLLFIYCLYRACRSVGLNVLPVILILAFSFSIAGAALFPLPLRLHGILGSPSILLVLSPVLGLFLWRKQAPPHVVLMSLVSFFVMALGFLAFMPDFMPEYVGIKQRFFHLGWSVWFVYLSYGFVQLEQRNNATEPERAGASE